MDSLIKTIKRLSEEDYRALLEQIAPNKHSKPYIVLESARHKDLTDSQMIEVLEVNPSTYYTLKSRLNNKVATILAKKVENPISVLLDEVSRVPANVYSTNKQVTIRALKELEKQLLEYDLSNELITVYRALSRLHTFSDEYSFYDKQYNKFVAFSLASAKAESLFYDFIKTAGNYELTKSATEVENLQFILRELSNITELYTSHRLFVYYNILRIYFLCMTTDNVEGLATKEVEIDKILQDIRAIFNKYPLDIFYSNLGFIVDALYFEYYQKIGNNIRAKYYYDQVSDRIPDISYQYILTFHVIRFLESKLSLSIALRDKVMLQDLNDRLVDAMEIDVEEVYHYTAFQQYLAVCKFYEGDYASAARIINNLRNKISLKSYWHTDVECKLFQALQYALIGEDDLCLQISNSISRYVREDKGGHKNIKAFIKFLKAATKEANDEKKIKKLRTLWDTFLSRNTGESRILPFLRLDDQVMEKLAN
jgi:hypothetical protein